MILFKTALTADQLQHLRELRAEPQKKPANKADASFLKLWLPCQKRPILTGFLVYLNLIAAAILIHWLVA